MSQSATNPNHFSRCAMSLALFCILRLSLLLPMQLWHVLILTKVSPQISYAKYLPCAENIRIIFWLNVHFLNQFLRLLDNLFQLNKCYIINFAKIYSRLYLYHCLYEYKYAIIVCNIIWTNKTRKWMRASNTVFLFYFIDHHNINLD